MAHISATAARGQGGGYKLFAPELEATCGTLTSDPNTKPRGRRRVLLPPVFQPKIRWFSRVQRPAR